MTSIDTRPSNWAGVNLTGASQRAPWMEIIRLWASNNEDFNQFSDESAEQLLTGMTIAEADMAKGAVAFQWIEHWLM